ncbi:MAG: hypothetical protein AAB425_13145 [Bdellovibrionota bacterium]
MIFWIGLLSLLGAGIHPSPAFAKFECPTTPDPARVIIFVPANYGKSEFEAVTRAACDRGETLVIVPEKRPPVAGKGFKGLVGNAWRRITSGFAWMFSRAKSDNGKKKFTPDDFDFTVKRLAAEGKVVTSIIGSGHDGGGTLYGGNGRISKAEIVKSIKDAYIGKPELLKQLESVHLFGCYTGTTAEVLFWKDQLPDLKVVQGFNGSAPLASRDESGALMYSVLMQSHEATKKTDIDEVSRAIDSMGIIQSTFAGMYVEACDRDFYYSNNPITRSGYLDPSRPAGSSIVDFSTALECNQESEEAKRNILILDRHFMGLDPIPHETQGTPLRTAYSFLRERQHCYTGKSYDGDRAGLLLFYHGVLENFAQTFESQLTDATQELAGFRAQVAEDAKSMPIAEASPAVVGPAGSTGYASYPKYSAYVSYPGYTAATNLSASRFSPIFGSRVETPVKASDLARAKADFDLHYDDAIRSIRLPEETNLASLNRKEVLDSLSALSWLLGNEHVATVVPAERFPALRDMYMKMERYLHFLDVNCMNFLEWHERVPGQIATPRC